MSYDNKPHIDRAAKLRILADLNRAIAQALEPDFHDDSTALDTHETNPKTWLTGAAADFAERVAKGRR
jgi:hypothetical protein